MTTPTNDDEPSGAYPTPQQALEFMQKMWNPFGVPMPGFGMPGMPQAAPTGAPGGAAGMPGMPFPNPAMMFAALDPSEVERKIGELRVIDSAVFRDGLADGQRSALRVWSAGAGVNWYANKNVRLVLDYERTWFRYGAKDKNGSTVDRAPESSMVGRVQTVF